MRPEFGTPQLILEVSKASVEAIPYGGYNNRYDFVLSILPFTKRRSITLDSKLHF